jgi:hypothetical protein
MFGFPTTNNLPTTKLHSLQFYPPPRKVLKITHTKDDDTEEAVEIVAV